MNFGIFLSRFDDFVVQNIEKTLKMMKKWNKCGSTVGHFLHIS